MATINRPPDGYLLTDQAFFAQLTTQETLAIETPDTLLLDIALFQATNEARRVAALPILEYDRALYQAARSHAASMIEKDFYSHENFHNLSDLNPLKRIQKQANHFKVIAENIGQYETIDTPTWFGIRFNSRSQRYEYIDLESKQVYQSHTYASYARYVVKQWLNSPPHRVNLLNSKFTHVGCAGRLSSYPFQQRRAPFGRVVQNFGAQRL
jgi:uncharacterized protein YkwD